MRNGGHRGSGSRLSKAERIEPPKPALQLPKVYVKQA